MRSIVLQHPETPREISVLLDGRVHLRLKPSLIPRPRHQLFVNRVTQVNDSCLPCGNSGKQVVTRRVLRERSHKGKSAAGKQSESALNIHRSPQSLKVGAQPAYRRQAPLRPISACLTDLQSVIPTEAIRLFLAPVFWAPGRGAEESWRDRPLPRSHSVLAILISLLPCFFASCYGSGIPGVATIPAILRIS
jgi:hypothetical protein